MALPDLKRLAKRALASRGFQFAHISAVEALDLHLTRLFATLGINCVLDVGAHKGDFGRGLRRLGYTGHIVSFEPVASSFEQLSAVAKRDPHWRTFRYALGERDETAQINVFGNSLFNSMLEASDFGRETFSKPMMLQRTERIEVRRLERVLETCLEGIPAPRLYLKLDTQGYDLAVVAGAGQALERFLGLQTEVALQPIYRDMPTTLCNTLPQLQRLGFEPTGFFPITRSKEDGLRIIELDCVMIRCPSRPA